MTTKKKNTDFEPLAGRVEVDENAAEREPPTTPLQKDIDGKKTKFIAALKSNGGNVSGALRSARISRTTAYQHFKDDPKFAAGWLDALEMSTDELFTEARRRATKGVLEPVYHDGRKVGSVRKYSDTLLIFLLKQGETHKKWRQRIIQTGNIALESVRQAGHEHGLTEEQIRAIQVDMQEKFQKISLI